MMAQREHAVFGAITVAVVVVLSVAWTEPANPSASQPRADLDLPRGLDPALKSLPGDRRVRVRVLLRPQPVLEAAQQPSFQRQIAMPSAARVRRLARRTPRQISQAEQKFAHSAEQRYEAAIDELDDEAFAAGENQVGLAGAIRRSGGKVLASEPVPSSVVARIPVRLLDELAGRRDVQAVAPAPKPKPQLDIARSVVGAPTWWAAGNLGGEGGSDTVLGDVGVLGEGPDATHPAFAGLMIDNSPLIPADDDHGTHVAGVIASGDLTYTGTAPGIDKLIGGLGSAYLLGVPSDEGSGAADPAETINVSFGGSPATDDDYDYADVLAALFGVGWTFGAGNDGPTGGTASGIGRNVLSVGAFNDLDTLSTTDDLVAGFSSRGPTPGGRKKPDLVAPGIGIVAPDAQWEGANPDFTSVQGTSFSAPFVAGGMALLEGAGITDPKVQRAILVNSARPWSGQTTWQPDVGWGALDLTAAFAQRANFQIGSVEEGSARFYRANQATGAKATLVWDRRGMWGSFPNCCLTAYTTTNLDLRQYVESTLVEVAPPSDPGHGGGPDAVDPNDTTEQVRAPAGGPQNVIYKVDAASTVEGAPSEPFAVAGAAPLTALTNPEVDPVGFSAAPSGAVNCLTDVTISTALENASPDLDAQNAQVTLALPAGVSLISGPATQSVSAGVLERSTPTSESHTWTVRATTTGDKEFTITGSGGTMGETFTASDRVSFTADCSPPAVAPTGSTVSPPPSQTPCGADRVVETTLRNGSITDAQAAQVSLAVPAGAELVAGPATQEVSGGVLEAGTTSEPHSWTVHVSQPGLAATITGSGTDGTQTFLYPETVSLDCQPSGGGPGDPAAVTLTIDKLQVKRGRLVVHGSASSPVGPPTGEVLVEVSAGNDRKAKQAALRNGGFSTRIKVCESGRWSAVARYEGAAGFSAAKSAPAVRRVRARQLRC